MEYGWVVEFDDIDVAIGCADDEQIALRIHRIHSLLALHRRNSSLLPQVPVLDGLVPRPRHDHGRV